MVKEWKYHLYFSIFTFLPCLWVIMFPPFGSLRFPPHPDCNWTTKLHSQRTHMEPLATSATVTAPVVERLQAGTENAPVLDHAAPLRRPHDSGAGYNYLSRLTYLLTCQSCRLSNVKNAESCLPATVAVAQYIVRIHECKSISVPIWTHPRHTNPFPCKNGILHMADAAAGASNDGFHLSTFFDASIKQWSIHCSLRNTQTARYANHKTHVIYRQHDRWTADSFRTWDSTFAAASAVKMCCVDSDTFVDGALTCTEAACSLYI